jgi:hypothetical protein
VETQTTDTGKPVLAVPEDSSKLPEVKSISQMFQEIKAVVSAGLLDEDVPSFKSLNMADGKPDYTKSSNLQNTLTGNVEPTATTTVCEEFGFELDLCETCSHKPFPFCIPESEALPIDLPERDQVSDNDLPQMEILKHLPDAEAVPQQSQTAYQSFCWADKPEYEDILDVDTPQADSLVNRILQTPEVSFAKNALTDVVSQPQKVNPSSVCMDQNQGQHFPYSDFRYKNKVVEGYTVIPMATGNNEHVRIAEMETPIGIKLEAVSPGLAPVPKTKDRANVPPTRTDKFHIRNHVVHTALPHMDEIGNIRNDNVGRILGKGGKNLNDWSNRFRVKITLLTPEEGDVKVTVTGGGAADRHAVIQEIMENLRVKVDVCFVFGSLSQEERRLSWNAFPFVKIEYEKKTKGYIFSGKLKDCRAAFEQLKIRRL